MIAKTDFSQPFKVAAYVRMSTDRQEDSPKQQRAEIKKLAERENCNIVTWYEDHGITGDSIDQRPEFQRMLRDAGKGAFSVILCDNQDRFGRFDSIEAGAVISPLRKSRVRMLTNAQGWIDWNDFASRMMYAIQTEGKHQFLHDLSRNITRSFANSNRPGTFIRSAPPGMCRVFSDQRGREQARIGAYEEFRCPKGWTVRLAPSANEQEREAMRWAFETYANTDVGFWTICRGLHARGVVSRAGTRLLGSTLRSLFRNKKYIGTVEAGTYAKGKYHRIDADGNVGRASEVPSSGSHHRRGHAVRVFDFAGEPLIDLATFERVQAKLDRRGLSKHKPRGNRYILSGILRCGHCGGPMHGKAVKHNPNHNTYYSCNGRATGKCQGHSIRADIAEPMVLELLRREVFGSETLDRLRAKVETVPTDEDAQQRKNIVGQLQAVEAKLDRARRNMALADTEDLPTFQAVLGELKEERERARAEARLLDSAADPTQILASAAELLKACADALRSSDPQAVRAVVAGALESVTLWFEPRKSHRVPVRGEAQVLGIPCLKSSPEIAEIAYLLRTALNYHIEIPESELRKTAVSRDVLALSAIYDGQPLLIREVAEAWGVSVAKAAGRIQRLRKAGQVSREGPHSGANVRWKPLKPSTR